MSRGCHTLKPATVRFGRVRAWAACREGVSERGRPKARGECVCMCGVCVCVCGCGCGLDSGCGMGEQRPRIGGRWMEDGMDEVLGWRMGARDVGAAPQPSHPPPAPCRRIAWSLRLPCPVSLCLGIRPLDRSSGSRDRCCDPDHCGDHGMRTGRMRPVDVTPKFLARSYAPSPELPLISYLS